jgi:beta-N-acetylhexosaminidase
MSSRSVSPDPKKVVQYAREFLAGLKAAKVAGAAKHFPGLGEADLDTHLDLPQVSRGWKLLWDKDLYPYRVMHRELPMVLVSHANYPNITKDALPASLSKKWITDVLRKKIGFRGLIASDDMEMGGVLKAAPIEEAAVQFVQAGGDLCLICHLEERVIGSYEAMVKKAEQNRNFAQRIKESAERIRAFKKKSAANRKATHKLGTGVADRLSRRVWEFSEEVWLANLARQAEA